VVVDSYGGDVDALWADAEDGPRCASACSSCPGFGKQKAQIFLALLGKAARCHAAGWREAAGDYGRDGSTMSVADVVDAPTHSPRCAPTAGAQKKAAAAG
jgi:uncharacterized HhH-GPD family protein